MIRLRNRAPRYPEEKTKDDDPRPTQRTQRGLPVSQQEKYLQAGGDSVGTFSALVLFVLAAAWVGASCGGALRYYAIASAKSITLSNSKPQKSFVNPFGGIDEFRAPGNFAVRELKNQKIGHPGANVCCCHIPHRTCWAVWRNLEASCFR